MSTTEKAGAYFWEDTVFAEFDATFILYMYMYMYLKHDYMYAISMQGGCTDGFYDCLQLHSCSQCLCSHGGKYAF
jgi:hypothetical protein